jgi:hypothetical protein
MTFNHASFGSISTGTLRTEDLLDSFAWELEHLVQRNADAWCSDSGRSNRDAYMALIGEAREIDPGSDDARELVEELSDALQDFAPAYAYFGAHPGDGADFGFWLSESMPCDFDGLRVSDTSEIPDDYSGEALHVNDHGNMSLFACDRGQTREIWSLV